VRVSSRSPHHRIGEATLSQELHTARLPRPHVLVGYWWQNTRLCLGCLQHNSYSCDFVSQPSQIRTCPTQASGSSDPQVCYAPTVVCTILTRGSGYCSKRRTKRSQRMRRRWERRFSHFRHRRMTSLGQNIGTHYLSRFSGYRIIRRIQVHNRTV